MVFLKIASKVWPVIEKDSCPLATALCDIGRRWAVIVATKGDACLVHLLGTISVQTRTRKKELL